MRGEVPPPPATLRGCFERLRGAYSDQTVRNYSQDVAIFEAWREDAGFRLPCSDLAYAAFVEFAAPQWTFRTVERRLYVARFAHRMLGLHDLGAAFEVKLALKRARKAHPHRPRQARGLTNRLRDQLLAACPNDLFGLRDRAIIHVGYDTLCRRSELVQLCLEDLQRLDDGTGKILIRKSKTDQFSVGQFAYVSEAGLATLDSWLTRACITGGPLFRGIWGRKVGKRSLHPRTVNRILTYAAESAGLPEELITRLTAHSFRVGAAQDLAVQGRTLVQIMRAGRWSNPEVVSHYVRQAEVNVWSSRNTIGSAESVGPRRPVRS